MPEMQKKIGGHPLVNYTDFEKLSHIIEHCRLQGFIVKNIECESTEANVLSHVHKEDEELLKYKKPILTF